MIFDQGLNENTWKHTNWIELDLQKGSRLNQHDQFESVTINPRGEAMDIICLDCKQTAERARMVLLVKYLIGC